MNTRSVPGGEESLSYAVGLDQDKADLPAIWPPSVYRWDVTIRRAHETHDLIEHVRRLAAISLTVAGVHQPQGLTLACRECDKAWPCLSYRLAIRA